MCNRISLAVILLVPVVWPSSSFGQFQVNGVTAQLQVNPRQRRLWRDQAVFYAGGGAARDMVESRGEYAARALLACSPGVARKLVAFDHGGLLDQLARPDALLYVIGLPNHGDDVCLFILDNAEWLRDVDTCDAFLMTPLDYTLSLKSLDDGAAEVHAMRLRQSSNNAWRTVVLIVGVVGAVGLLVWRQRMFI